jgi:hypothetical protein
MREIKFRAKDELGNWWYTSTKFKNDKGGLRKLTSATFWLQIENEILKRDTLSEWSGSKDILKADIYEGHQITNHSRNSGRPHAVKFEDGKFIAIYGSLQYDFSQEIERENITIVGDIY